MDLGVKANVVEKSGSWYSYKGNRLGQGRESARQYLKDNPDVMTEIEKAIRADASELAQKMIMDDHAPAPAEEGAAAAPIEE